MPPTPIPVQPVVVRAHGHTRSTQSFVHVMASVWTRPGLTAMEVAWRWIAGAPIVAMAWHWIAPRMAVLQANVLPLQGLSLVHPVESLATLGSSCTVLAAMLWPLLRWLGPLGLVWWVSVGTVGQGLWMGRFAQSGSVAWGAVWAARLGRSCGVLFSWLLWAKMCAASAAWTITGPSARGQEPAAMGLVALVITGSLAIFVGWAGLSSPLCAVQTLAVTDGLGFFAGLRRAFGSRALRGQVLEVNLVLCIVKIALLVLLMVFSACPLPFESVETKGFLIDWTLAVTVWYLLMSDLFHVVRLAAYLRLVQADEHVQAERLDSGR